MCLERGSRRACRRRGKMECGRCRGPTFAYQRSVRGSVGFLLCLREWKLFHVWSPTAALRSSSFQKARSRIQLTRTTEVASEASLRAETAKRDVSQLALQPRVLVRRVRDCAGGRARYGSKVEGVRFRCDEAIVMLFGGGFWRECYQYR